MIKNLKHFKIKTERELTKILHDHIKYSPKLSDTKVDFMKHLSKQRSKQKGMSSTNRLSPFF